MNLESLGWNVAKEREFTELKKAGMIPGRIICCHLHGYQVICEKGIFDAVLIDRPIPDKKERIPVTGDWVAFSPSKDHNPGYITKVFSRKTEIHIKNNAFKSEYGMISGANMDFIFLGVELDQRFNVRDMERELTLLYDSGAVPVILLFVQREHLAINEKIADVESIAFGIPIHVIQEEEKKGYDDIRRYFKRGTTGAFLIKSPHHRSGIHNALLGADQNRLPFNWNHLKDTASFHSVSLFPLIGEGLLMDFPCIDVMLPKKEEKKVSSNFQDIETLIKNCRFSNCTHTSEPGCAINQALEAGELDEKLFRMYRKALEKSPPNNRRNGINTSEEKDRYRTIRRAARRNNKVPIIE